MAAALAASAMQQYLYGGSRLFTLCCIPYALLYAFDTIATPLVLPPAQRQRGKAR